MSMVTAAHFAKEKPLQQATDTFSVEHAQLTTLKRQLNKGLLDWKKTDRKLVR